jgi:hypothetical protein
MAGWHLSEQAREALRTARDLARGRRAVGSSDPLLSRSSGNGMTSAPAVRRCCAPAG